MKLTLEHARLIVARAVAKAAELAQCGAFVTVDDGGNALSISRMDGAGATSVGVSRAKAYLAAVNREPSARFVSRIARGDANLFVAYRDTLRDHIFPGPGAVPVVVGGHVVGALSTGAGIGPSIAADGVDPLCFIVDGNPANAEDLIICHALGIPYRGQHGDDRKRWSDAYGSEPPSEGFTVPPHIEVRQQPQLDGAIAMNDRVIAAARVAGLRVTVVVTDRHGDIVQLDRMDGASPMTPYSAHAKAATAVNFQRPSGEINDDAHGGSLPAMLAGLGRFPYLPAAGGRPILDGDVVVGGIGVCSTDPQRDDALALAGWPT